MADKRKKSEVAINMIGLWVARVSIAVLVFAGGMYFLSGKLDVVILYPAVAIVEFFLLKEAL